MSRPRRRLSSLAAILVLLWLGGFGWFVATSVLVQADRVSQTDSIVVLTGGRMRLEAGVALLAAGKARKLFVSGVNPRVDRDALLRALGPAAERAACCIVLGRAADNTFGNAQETANWIRTEGYRSLRLVTSWYHMRRSLLEFSRAMPHVTIVAHPVFAPPFDPEGWRGWFAAVPLVIGEYHKYAASWLAPFIGLAPPQPSALKPVIRTTAMLRGAPDRPPPSC